MKKFVPYEKLSKKKKKEINNKKRQNWGTCNPATKVVPSEKEYTRKIKHKKSAFDDDSHAGFYL